MKLSTEFAYATQLFGTEAAIPMLAEAGYDALDFSMYDARREDNPVSHDDYKERMASFKKIAEDSGICFNQTHAPFPNWKNGDEAYNLLTYPRLIRAIEATALLGAPVVVMHPGSMPDHEAAMEANIKHFKTLQPYCEEFGVKIAIENVIVPEFNATAQQHITLMDSLDSRYFTALIDVGHAEINNVGAAEFIRAMGGERLGALHIHDNDKVHDLHNLPFTRSIDFKEITRALAEIDYKGDFTLESGFFIRYFDGHLAKDAYRMMAQVGHRLIQMIEDAKKEIKNG